MPDPTPTDSEACPKSNDGMHCQHWYDCEPCCACGCDEGGEDDCDCPRHTAMRETGGVQ